MFRTVLLLVAITLFIPVVAFSQYKVMLSNDYPPYNYINDNGELVGFNVDIVKAIKNLYDDDFVYGCGSWDSINIKLDNGEIQAIAGAHYPGIQENDYIYTRSAINTSHCFLYNENHIKHFSLEMFRSMINPVVAIWESDVLVHYVLSINPTARFIYVNDYKYLTLSLDRKDVTCIFAQRVGVMFQAEKLGKKYIRPLDHRILERNMGFKVSKDYPELATIFNNGLEVILANGEYQRIYDKWINKYNKNYNIWDNYLKYIFLTGGILIVLFFLLLGLNWMLRTRIRNKTKDLQQQLALNSRIMRELEQQKIKAEESEKMKSAFLANMSHEIRTPMNGILGFANLLKAANYSPEKQLQFIEIIQQSGNRMLNTINNIIDVSKLESGAERTIFKKVNIKSLITELINFFTIESNTKGIKLILEEKTPIATYEFFTDEYKLNSILTNLIKNAIKFTSEGYIKVNYSVNETMVEFWITDTGIGIDRDKQAKVFEHFVQADNSYSRGFEGSGLGLSITKGYVNILKGEITLNSQPQKGTTFYVRIPNYKEISKNINNNEVHKINITNIS